MAHLTSRQALTTWFTGNTAGKIPFTCDQYHFGCLYVLQIGTMSHMPPEMLRLGQMSVVSAHRHVGFVGPAQQVQSKTISPLATGILNDIDVARRLINSSGGGDNMAVLR